LWTGQKLLSTSKRDCWSHKQVITFKLPLAGRSVSQAKHMHIGWLIDNGTVTPEASEHGHLIDFLRLISIWSMVSQCKSCTRGQRAPKGAWKPWWANKKDQIFGWITNTQWTTTNSHSFPRGWCKI
jgi:hypothetical protein